jgi:hypothetical protein
MLIMANNFAWGLNFFIEMDTVYFLKNLKFRQTLRVGALSGKRGQSLQWRSFKKMTTSVAACPRRVIVGQAEARFYPQYSCLPVVCRRSGKSTPNRGIIKFTQSGKKLL